jgi:hypothetical protein
MVSLSERDQLRKLAHSSSLTVSRLIAAWLSILMTGRTRTIRRSVRRHKRELFVTLPRDWIERTGVQTRDKLTVIQTDDYLLISRK